MLKLNATPEILRKSLAHEDISPAQVDDLISEIGRGNSRSLFNDHGAGVIQILKDAHGRVEMFLKAWGGSRLTAWLKDLIKFASQNRVNSLLIQTKNKSVYKIITQRYGFLSAGYVDGNFIMRKAF